MVNCILLGIYITVHPKSSRQKLPTLFFIHVVHVPLHWTRPGQYNFTQKYMQQQLCMLSIIRHTNNNQNTNYSESLQVCNYMCKWKYSAHS